MKIAYNHIHGDSFEIIKSYETYDGISMIFLAKDDLGNKYYCHFCDNTLDEKGNILEDVFYAVLIDDHDIELLETKQITLRNVMLFAEPKYKFYDNFARFTEVYYFNKNNLPVQGITL